MQQQSMKEKYATNTASTCEYMYVKAYAYICEDYSNLIQWQTSNGNDGSKVCTPIKQIRKPNQIKQQRMNTHTIRYRVNKRINEAWVYLHMFCVRYDIDSTK